MDHAFQVDLRGLIELLSGHLYSGPSVFVRELLQNGVDAIHARRQRDSKFIPAIHVELIASRDNRPTLVFQDNGIGLSENEVHAFLATIGSSSKRGEGIERPNDFLGQFGIGLLSCFMVTDEIVMITKSAEVDSDAVEWRGRSNGTYTVRKLTQPMRQGTQVFLQAKETAADLFQPDRLITLLRNFGEYLPPPIDLTADGQTTRINRTPPWMETVGGHHDGEQLLTLGSQLFDRPFLDAIPLQSSAGDVRGIAFVLAEPVHAGSDQPHRVYLKNMLLSAAAHNLLPEWAFFAQCIVNSNSLRPTASREAFYEDLTLEHARDELGGCLRRYLLTMTRTDPDRLQQLISVHHLAIKSLANTDDECLAMFAGWLPFETSLGTMTLAEFRRESPTLRYVPSRDQFRQVAQFAAAQSLPIINAGYIYDAAILERIAAVVPGVEAVRFQVDDLCDRFEELTLDERRQTVEFERIADASLQRYKCSMELRKFEPLNLPALYVTDQNADFIRFVQQSHDVADDVWKNVLDQLTEDRATTYARLLLNYSNRLVRRICSLSDERLQLRCVEMLYVQALLLGHFPLNRGELKLLSEGLLGLIDRALELQEGSTHE